MNPVAPRSVAAGRENLRMSVYVAETRDGARGYRILMSQPVQMSASRMSAAAAEIAKPTISASGR